MNVGTPNINSLQFDTNSCACELQQGLVVACASDIRQVCRSSTSLRKMRQVHQVQRRGQRLHTNVGWWLHGPRPAHSGRACLCARASGCVQLRRRRTETETEGPSWIEPRLWTWNSAVLPACSTAPGILQPWRSVRRELGKASRKPSSSVRIPKPQSLNFLNPAFVSGTGA